MENKPIKFESFLDVAIFIVHMAKTGDYTNYNTIRIRKSSKTHKYLVLLKKVKIKEDDGVIQM